MARAADALAGEVLDLYAGGPFACRQPDDARRVVRTILDFVYVGRCMTDDLPAEVRRGRSAFFERELMTEDRRRALSLDDADALTRELPAFQTWRADHQATGAYDGWPAWAADVLIRFGHRERALAWLARIQELHALRDRSGRRTWCTPTVARAKPRSTTATATSPPPAAPSPRCCSRRAE